MEVPFSTPPPIPHSSGPQESLDQVSLSVAPEAVLPFNLTENPRRLDALVPHLRSALATLLSNQPFTLPDVPERSGGLGAAFKVRVGDRTLKFKTISDNSLEGAFPGPNNPDERPGFAPLDGEDAILSLRKPSLPCYFGRVLDAPNSSGARSVVGILSEWVEGNSADVALREGRITNRDLKVLIRRALHELARDGIRVLDSNPSNFIIQYDPMGNPVRARMIDAGVCADSSFPSAATHPDPATRFAAQRRWFKQAFRTFEAIDHLKS